MREGLRLLWLEYYLRAPGSSVLVFQCLRHFTCLTHSDLTAFAHHILRLDWATDIISGRSKWVTQCQELYDYAVWRTVCSDPHMKNPESSERHCAGNEPLRNEVDYSPENNEFTANSSFSDSADMIECGQGELR